METQLLISLGAIAVLLLLSAFFSGSETSLTAASRARMHTLEQQGVKQAQVVNKLLAGKDRLIGAILFGNNLVNIMASALATSVLIGLFGEAGVAYATLVMTFLVLIFAEVLPKTYAIHNADRVALAVAPVLRLVVQSLAPITQAIQVIVRGTMKLFRLNLDPSLDADLAAEELRGAIDLHTGRSKETREARHMLRSILDLAELEVEEIMTHRQNLVTIDADLPPEEIVNAVLSSPYTRFPLWRGDADNIVGVVHAKALLRAVHAHHGDITGLDVVKIANRPWFIPESTDLLSQLEAFRVRHEHFSLVVDEYGELLGIVTLEDILEEIVGEIADEHDIEVEGVEVQKDGSIIVAGSVTLRDLNRKFDWNLPDEEASTIAGLVLHEARSIPETGQVFIFYNHRMEILERQRNQITLIKITPIQQPTEDAKIPN